jgi:quinol monooxygenase YgiN
MFDVGIELTSHFASPYTRTVLEPVLFAGLGEPITDYPGFGDQMSGDAGVVLIFRVLPGPDRDLEVEAAMRAIFEAMAVEEFPSGDVKAYGVYSDRCEPGKWVMFEHFTERGSENHAKGPLMKAAGTGLERLFITPYKRVMLSPALFVGCGETISDSSLRQVAPETG